MRVQFKLNYGAFQLDVDLQLPDTGITVLFGHSGSGKTTLLRCIAGLHHAPKGFLEVKNIIWQNSEKNYFLPTYQRALGYVFQDANLLTHLTVKENLYYGLKRIGQHTKTALFEQLIELLGLSSLMQRMPAHLSGGEQQRVAIARALVLNPDILLMDEPLVSLDIKRKQEILPFLNRLHTELQIPLLYVTHSVQEVAQLADYLVLLDNGKIQAAGLLTETLNRLDLPQAYDSQAFSVWQVTVIAHETAYHLTIVAFENHQLYLPAIHATLGTVLRIQIYARDVSITLSIANESSILNRLPATITAMCHAKENSLMVVRLQVGSQSLLAHITCKSAHVLNLHLGMAVYVQIKSTSILN